MKKHFLLFALLVGTTFSAEAQYGPGNNRFPQNNDRLPQNNRVGRGNQNSWNPNNRNNRCNGNCACGGRDFYYEAMPENDFSLALQQLKEQSFDADRLRTARYIASTSYMLTRQVVTLAELFSFSKSKKDFLIAAYPACLDKSLYFQAVNTLSFSKDREEVWNAIDNMR